MTNLNGKLTPHLVWMFSLVTLGIALVVTKAMPGPVSPKTAAAIYFAIFGAGATAAMYLTRATVLLAIGAFAVGAIGLGVYTYLSIAGRDTGSTLGQGLGVYFTAMFLGDALAASVAGTLFGWKLRTRLRPAIAS